ncbi:MAG: murein biosynthesis integral membrane protein MurJ [Synergistes sp.]|nr:murein biosynthesis integral membrane protein MurJ [Synergistes sp.]
MKEEISSACGPENTAQENSKRPDALTGCADPSLREAQSEKSATESKRPDALSGMVTHAMRMMAGTLLSRVLGLIREMLTAALFGATRQLDAFFVAYTIANLARQLLAEGALSASFVPVFSRVLETEGNVRARKLANEAVSVLMCGCALVIIAGILFSPVIVGIIAPGFAPDEKALAVALSRAMFPFLLLVSAAALAMGVLNSMGCFFIPSIAPALSNLAYILFLLASRRHLSVWNLAMAVLLGGFCHMMLQVIWCSRLKMPLRPVMPRRDDTQLRSMMALFLPYAAGLSLNQLNPVISRMLGSFLSAGSISVLTYADRVLQLPLGLFVITISQAVLPMLSRQNPENTAEFRDFARDAIRFNLFVILPVTVGLAIVSKEVVHILFYRGAFSEWAWGATATALSLYALGLPGMASNTVIMRAIYARRLPRAAIMVTGVTVCVNLAASLLLMRKLGYAGLALAGSSAFTAAALFAAYLLARDIGEKLSILETKWLARILPPLLLMGGFLLALKYFFPYPVNSGMLRRLSWLAVSVAGSIIVYGVSTIATHCSEWRWIKGALAGKRR